MTILVSTLLLMLLTMFRSNSFQVSVDSYTFISHQLHRHLVVNQKRTIVTTAIPTIERNNMGRKNDSKGKKLRSTSFPIDGDTVITTTTTTKQNSKELPDGMIKSIIVRGNGAKVRLGDIATLRYSCYVVPDSQQLSPTTTSTQPFAKSSTAEKMVVGNDGTMIDGWDIALRSMEIGERSIIRITDPRYGYGTKGYPPYIPPNAVIEMDMTILDAVPPTMNIDFDSIADQADRNVPRTAKDIAAAYEKRLEIAKNTKELEGIDYWLNKVQNFYFYGFFGSETGATTPPWFLRPSITFPIAFSVVGLTFYVSLYYGAITERGMPTTDELDEIILSSSTTTIPSTLLLSSSSEVTTYINHWYQESNRIQLNEKSYDSIR